MDTTFERTTGEETWLTPPDILDKLGKFDLDPCAAVNQPWRTADNQYTIIEDGLKKEWFGRVWCNPPYGKKAELFLQRMKKHKNGIVLIFCRPETNNWFDNIWYFADSILFIKGRIRFYDMNGVQRDSAGCASVLVAYGKENTEALEKSGIKGILIRLKNESP